MTCDHTWQVLRYVEHAPIDEDDPIAHTNFYVLGCVRCRATAAFPIANAVLCTQPFTDALNAALDAAGYRVPFSTILEAS